MYIICTIYTSNIAETTIMANVHFYIAYASDKLIWDSLAEWKIHNLRAFTKPKPPITQSKTFLPLFQSIVVTDMYIKQKRLLQSGYTCQLLNIQYYFWWRDYCFGLIIHHNASVYLMVSISDEYKYKRLLKTTFKSCGKPFFLEIYHTRN